MSAMRIWNNFIEMGVKQERDRIKVALEKELRERLWLPTAVERFLTRTGLNKKVHTEVWYQSYCPICDSSIGAYGEPGRKIHQRCLADLNDQLRDIFGEVFHREYGFDDSLKERVEAEMQSIIGLVIQRLQNSLDAAKP